jgi:hypothetical protein
MKFIRMREQRLGTDARRRALRPVTSPFDIVNGDQTLTLAQLGCVLIPKQRAVDLLLIALRRL